MQLERLWMRFEALGVELRWQNGVLSATPQPNTRPRYLSMYCDSARWMKSSVGDGGGAPVSDLVSPFWPKTDIWRSVGGESRWVGGRSRVGVEKVDFL